MPKPKPPYPPEFRAGTIRLARTSRTPPSQLARESGMTGETLRQWPKTGRSGAGTRSDGLTSDAQEELRRLRRENRMLREEREILKRRRRNFRSGDQLDPVKAFELVEREKVTSAVVRLCRVLGVSPGGYWAWRTRAPSARTQADHHLTGQIAAIHQASRSTYGAPRVHAELRATGIRCGRQRVARLMRQAGLVGCHRRRAVQTTQRDPAAEGALGLERRQCTAREPNVLWIADSTSVPTSEGFLYLAVILDV